eukprot:8012185-Karenia_brevis.AAC.1
MTTWRMLFVQHQQRLHPGTEDPGVLEAIHGFPDVMLLDEMADLQWRQKLPEPGAGMPMRRGFGLPDEILERPEDDDPEFDIYIYIYMSEYVEVTESLEKIRAPWLEK